jgi:hypothetical protein
MFNVHENRDFAALSGMVDPDSGSINIMFGKIGSSDWFSKWFLDHT